MLNQFLAIDDHSLQVKYQSIALQYREFGEVVAHSELLICYEFDFRNSYRIQWMVEGSVSLYSLEY